MLLEQAVEFSRSAGVSPLVVVFVSCYSEKGVRPEVRSEVEPHPLQGKRKGLELGKSIPAARAHSVWIRKQPQILEHKNEHNYLGHFFVLWRPRRAQI